MQHLTNISNIPKKQIMKIMDRFVEEPKLIDLVFGVNISVDVKDFLISCDFVGATQTIQVMFFFCFIYTQIALQHNKKKKEEGDFDALQCGSKKRRRR